MLRDNNGEMIRTDKNNLPFDVWEYTPLDRACLGMVIRGAWNFDAPLNINLLKTVLSNLKNDPEKFVQKSVGNNLNDLVKAYPDKAKEIITDWQAHNPSRETLWIIKHGLRSGKLDI